MKQSIYILISLLLATGSISCKKTFLDVENNTIILREQYVKDINTLQEYLNGIYISLAKDFYTGISGPQIYTDLIADNIKPNTTNTSILMSHYWWNQSLAGSQSSGPHMNALWLTGYQLIRACSFAIERAEQFKGENPAKADQIEGEAYSIRALIHFVLVNIFAQPYNYTNNADHPGIPYITSWDWNDPFSRSTVREVYENMINDLDKAIPLLVASNANKIVMNQYAAKALIARIYLFKEDWLQAKVLATEIATSIPLLTVNLYPAKLFTPEETEALFQLAPSSPNAITGSYATAFQGFYYRSTAFLATKDIADLLKQNPNDSRNKWISTSSISKDSIRKYPVGVVANFGTGTNPNRSYYQTLFRSSEMYLTAAEAAAKTNDEVTARTYLDAIRQRADPSLPNTTAAGAALLDSIYLERRKELAFEGLRMWDLLRWKQGVKRKDVGIGAPMELPYPSDKAIAPIPLPDVNYGIPQNPSY